MLTSRTGLEIQLSILTNNSIPKTPIATSAMPVSSGGNISQPAYGYQQHAYNQEIGGSATQLKRMASAWNS